MHWDFNDRNFFSKIFHFIFMTELFSTGINHVYIRCVHEEEQWGIVNLCHSSFYEGH